MSQVILSLKNVSKSYGKHVVLDDISFSIDEGKIMGFIGVNGAGKTTTLKIISGLTKASSGNVTICGIDLKKNFEACIEKVGAVIENPVFYNGETGMNNLCYFAKFYNSKITKNEVAEIAQLVGLKERINDKVYKYSLGMKQRLGLAQALLNKPKLLILDEPTNGLDIKGVIELRAILKDLATSKKTSILVSSHSLGEIQKICDEYIIIDNGKIIDKQSIHSSNASNFFTCPYYIKTSQPNFAGRLIKECFGIDVKIYNSEQIVFDSNETQIPLIFKKLNESNVNVIEFGKFSDDIEKNILKKIN